MKDAGSIFIYVTTLLFYFTMLNISVAMKNERHGKGGKGMGCAGTVQTHLKREVFLRGFQRKKPSFTAFKASTKLRFVFSALESPNAALHVHAFERAWTDNGIQATCS